MPLFLRWLIMVAAIIISSYIVPGVTVAGFWTVFWVSLLLGVLNISLKPLLVLVTLPINVLTLGLFTFVINALLVLLTSTVIKGFEVHGFISAILFSILLSAVSYMLNALAKAR